MSTSVAQIGLLEDEAILLDEAALALAALDHPSIDLNPYVDRLAFMAAQLISRATGAVSAHDRARLLQDVIAEEHGFGGDRNTYEDPANADFIAALDRRRGLPVTLAILYVSLARKVGWMADALNMPGHVLVRIGQDPGSVIQDPFNHGIILNGGALDALLASVLGDKTPPEPEHFASLSNRAVLVRLLTNQAARSRRDGDSERALLLYERMTMLAPSFTGLWWERARLEQLLGRVHSARNSLTAMLETTRDPTLITRIEAALSALARSIN
jgi:regulator of sirC expression with transglutaminase-like and TPR domain